MTGEAARRFAQTGSDLDVLALPANVALRQGLASTGSLWLHHEGFVPLTHLADAFRHTNLVERLGIRVW